MPALVSPPSSSFLSKQNRKKLFSSGKRGDSPPSLFFSPWAACFACASLRRERNVRIPPPTFIPHSSLPLPSRVSWLISHETTDFSGGGKDLKEFFYIDYRCCCIIANNFPKIFAIVHQKISVRWKFFSHRKSSIISSTKLPSNICFQIVSTSESSADPAELQALLAAGNVTTVQEDRQVFKTQVRNQEFNKCFDDSQ